MTNEEKITRLRWIQRYTPILTGASTRDFEALEAAIEAIETLDKIESRLGKELKEIEEGILADNRLMAVSGMSIEKLTDVFTKGYRLVSTDAANDQVPNMRVTKVTIDEARIVFQLDKETEGKQSEEQNGIFIPENATNGDVIRALFPNLYSYDGENYVLLDLSGFCGGKIEEKWWDAPYKAESMTNGDVIKGVFPNAEIKHGFYGIDSTPMVCLCLHTNTEMYKAFFCRRVVECSV